MKMRAPFRYWGSKVRMAPWIIDRLPPHDHFVEACAGSAAVMAIKEPVMAETVNDTYGEVVNFFQVIREKAACAELIDLVAATPYSLAEFQEAGLTHYPDPLYDSQGFDVAGDYESHRNVPNGEGRDVKVERLYIAGGNRG